METSALCDQQGPSAEMYAWLHIPPSPKSHIYRPPPNLFGAVPQSYWRGYFLGHSPHFAPQPNLTHSSHFVHFFFKLMIIVPKHDPVSQLMERTSARKFCATEKIFM